MGGYYRHLSITRVASTMPRIALLVFLLAAASTAPYALGDESEPPLYVATTGSDQGDCRVASAPCQTIDYALQRVGKNGQIRVAGGTYSLAEVENLAYFLSDAIDVRGGYSEADQFSVRVGAPTTLVGAPHAFADALSQRGFRAIVDSKGLSAAARARSAALVKTQQSLSTSTAATPCNNGQAGVFPCNDVDLLAHIPDRTDTADGTDIWGFVDLNSQREYAIVGYSIGTAVYDVSDAENPREVGFIDGQRTTWRDIKVHQFWNEADARWNAYAYITADNASDGLFILDFSDLPHSVSKLSYSSDFDAAHNVYLTGTDFTTGLATSAVQPSLLLAGSNRSDGRFRSYSLADPSSPTYITMPVTPGGQAGNDRLYMHDAASMQVSDARKDTQCENAASSDFCDIVFDFNEGSLEIWDVTQPANPVRLSQTSYSNAEYVHSGWWTEDQSYVFVQDELDELNRGLPTTLRVFSIDDLTAPVLAGTWTGPTNAIDHNGFVRGNRYYMSNYARGLTILDISNPASPVTVGRFDTYPASDTVGFPGAWGTYPFLPSGNLLISDIDSGLYVVADKTLGVAEGTFSFAAASFASDESGPAQIVVQRNGGGTGAVSVNWELLSGSASYDDVTGMRGTVSWDAGDVSERVIEVHTVNDGAAEGMERMLVRLTSPTGGATLSAPNIASLYISDPGESPLVEFDRANVAIAERGFSTAVAVVQRRRSAAGDVSVDYTLAGGTATIDGDFSGPQSGTLFWPDGDADPKWIEYTIFDDGEGESTENFTLALGNATGAALGTRTQLKVDIVDGTGVNSAPNAVAGAGQVVNARDNVTLDGTGSNDPDNDALSYSWNQVLGAQVTLTGADTDTATFTAPTVTSDTLLRFELTVSDASGLTDTAEVTITVRAQESPQPQSSGSGPLSLWLLSALGIAALRRRFTRMDET